MVSFLAFVGASVLPSGSAAAVRSVVAGRLASLDSSSVVVVSGGASGVDSIAVDVAKSMGFETLVFAPKTNDWPGFKARNIQIAQKAGSIIVITLPLYKGGRKGECYHCNRVGKNNQHQVSGGCWTGKLHRNYEVVVLPSPLSCKHSYPKPSVLSNNIISPVSILIMSSIKHKKVHPHGVATMDQYFDHITEVVAETFKKEEDDEASSTDSFSNHSYEIHIDSNGTERVRYNRYLNSEYNVIDFSNQYNYYNYYNAKSLFITIKMNNMKNLSIPLMTKQETKQVSKYKPYIKSVEFTEGVRKAYFVINIEMIEQSFKGVVKMEDFTTVDLATGKETEGTRPLKGYELTLVDKDDPDRKARLLSVNKSEGVSFIDELVKERKSPIGTFIAGEEIELERVQNDFGYNPSILPVGA